MLVKLQWYTLNLLHEELSKLNKEGLIQVYGTNDILTQALEKLEHSGRVRAVGAEFILKTYFTTTEVKKKIIICKRRTSGFIERTKGNTRFAIIKNERNGNNNK